jgi:hypothetical protein
MFIQLVAPGLGTTNLLLLLILILFLLLPVSEFFDSATMSVFSRHTETDYFAHNPFQ